NVMIYEVQQSSDLTFRIYDYNRPGADGKARELHIDRSLDVLNFGEHTPEPQHWTNLPGATPEHTLLAKSEHFQFERFAPKNEKEHTYPTFSTLTILNGQAELNGSNETFTAQTGDTVFITANRTVTVSPQNEVEYLISSIP
ncbi:MAG: hypothetical protein QGG64_22635, partial [Candidatus Latescibacteria bacterium]|nr:hypothetical protein [Candidatus Latescibacterota bacterium]